MRLIYCAPESQLNWLDMPHIPNFLTFEMIVTSKNKLVLHEYLCAVFWQYIVLAKSVSSFAGGFIAVWTSVCNQHGCFHSAVRACARCILCYTLPYTGYSRSAITCISIP